MYLWMLIILVWQLYPASGEKARQNFGADFVPVKRAGVGGARSGKTIRFPAVENVEDLVGFYEPSFLAQVWPKLRNGMHLNMRNACWEDVTIFMKNLLQGRAWAYSMVDSSGRYETGLLGGNRFWIGSKDQCLQLDQQFRANLDNSTLEELRHGDYLSTIQRQQELYGSQQTWKSLLSKDELLQRIIAADNTPPYRLAFSAVLAQLNITKATLHKTHQIVLGVCLPLVCTASDIHELLDFSILINGHLKSNNALPRSVKIIRVRPLSSGYSISTDSSTMMLLLFSILLVLFVIFATLIDLNLINFMTKTSRSFDVEQPGVVMGTAAMEIKTITTIPNERVDKNLRIHPAIARTTPKEICSPKSSFVMPGKFPDNLNVIDMEKMTINEEIIFKTVQKTTKSEVRPSSIALDVVPVNDGSSCRRCGRYRKQCQNLKTPDDSTLPACPRVNYEKYEVVTTENKRVEAESFEWSPFLRSLVLSFSLNLNIRKIFNINGHGHSLNAVHGLKIISILWIIYTHMALVYFYLADNGGDIGKNSSIHKILSSGTFSFDTLFLISGLLSAHHYFCLKNRYSTKELVNFSGAFGKLLQFVCFVTNRAVRLLPPYMFVIFLTSSLARRHRATAVLQLAERDHSTCDQYWWRNVLYVNTFYSARERCAQWSWYLSADTQLHVAGVLLLCAASCRARVAAVLAAAAVVTACATDSILAYSNHREAESISDLYEELFNRPWTRLGPYLVGVFAGWLLYHLDCKLRIGRPQAALLWVASAALACCAATDVFGAELGRSGRAAFPALAHTAWSLAASWFVVACVTGHGGLLGRVLAHNCLFPLSRISYCVYLVHPLIIRALLLSTNTTTHIDGGLILVSYIGVTALSLLGGLTLTLLMETPFSCLLRRALHCNGSAT